MKDCKIIAMYNSFNGLFKRMFWWKLIWFAFSFVGFLYIILVWISEFYMLAWGLLFWYPIVGAMVWVMWIIDRYPVAFKFRLYIWRGVFLGLSMNLALVFMAYDKLHSMINIFFRYDFWPFMMFSFFLFEWMFVWGFIDYVCTKMFGEGERLLKK